MMQSKLAGTQRMRAAASGVLPRAPADTRRSRSRSRERKHRSRSRSRERHRGSRRSRSRKHRGRSRSRERSRRVAEPPPPPPPPAPAPPAPQPAPPPAPPPPPPAPAAAAAPAAGGKAPRYVCRDPKTGELVPPYKLSVYRAWVADGKISAETAATTRFWPKGADESTGVPLATLLAQNPA